MRFEYIAGSSLLHRLDVRVKLLLFVVAVAVTFQFGAWPPNLLLAAAAAALLLIARVRPAAIFHLLAPLSVIVLLIIFFAALSFNSAEVVDPANRVVLFTILPGGGWPLTRGGLVYGVVLGLRILTMVMLTTLLLVTTPIDHFVAAMRQARVPHPLVLIVMTALRFIPTMQHRAEQVLDAQRSRGARIDSGGMIGRVRAYIPVMVPLLTSGIRMSDDLAAAMINRGYGATKRPTALLVLHLRMIDVLVAVVGLLVLMAAITLRSLGWWAL